MPSDDIEPSAKKHKLDEHDSYSVNSQNDSCVEDEHESDEEGSDENCNLQAHFSQELLKNIAELRSRISVRKGQDKLSWELALKRAIRFFEKLPTCDVQHELDAQKNLKTTIRMIKKLAKSTEHEEKLKSPIWMANWNYDKKMVTAAKDRAEKVKNLEIERFLLKTPSSAKEAMTDVCEDEQAAKANVYLLSISLLAMGFTIPELKNINDWTFYNRKREAVKDPLYGVYFLKTGTDYWMRLPVHSNFLPTARYLGENKEVWNKIRKNFVLTKSYNFYATKIRGIALLECEAFRNYMSEGGKLQDIRDHVNTILEKHESPKYANSDGGFYKDWKYRPEYHKQNIDKFLITWMNALRKVSRKDDNLASIEPTKIEDIDMLHFKILQGSQELDTK